VAREQVVKRDEHGSRHDPPLATWREELRAGFVIGVAGIQGSDDRARV
jgi:hypothetical protein